MRGADTFTESLFSVRKLDDFVPAAHPLRPVRKMVNTALAKMDALFSRMYEADIKGGRPSIADFGMMAPLYAHLAQPIITGNGIE